MAANKLKGHPQEQIAIRMLMDGKTIREVARVLDPPVSHMAVHRFFTANVKPAITNAAAVLGHLSTSPQPDPLEPLLHRPFQGENTVTAPRPSTSPVGKLVRNAFLSIPALGIRENRIAAKQERWARVMTIVEERAREMSLCQSCFRPEDAHPWESPEVAINGRHSCDVHQPVPGGSSGFLTRDYKGKDATTPVYKFDDALFKAFSEVEKEVAIELGQWQEQMQPTVSVQIVCPSAPDPQNMPSIRTNARPVELRAGADGIFEEIGLLTDGGRR